MGLIDKMKDFGSKIVSGIQKPSKIGTARRLSPEELEGKRKELFDRYPELKGKLGSTQTKIKMIH